MRSTSPLLPGGDVSGSEFLDILTRATDRLGKTVTTINSSSIERDQYLGWDRHLGRNRIGISSTAFALGVLSRLEPNSPLLNRAAATVVDAFLEEEIEGVKVGGWPISAAGETVVLTEGTCYCVSQLVASRCLRAGDPMLDQAVTWLLKNQSREEGWWEPRIGANVPFSRVFITALVVQTLVQVKMYVSEARRGDLEGAIGRATSWLRHGVNVDGGWGRQPKDGATDPWHTAMVILALQAVGYGSMSALTMAARRLVEMESRWGETIYLEYEIESDGRIGRVPYSFHPQPIATVALLKMGYSAWHPPILPTIRHIVEKNPWIVPGSQEHTIFEVSYNVSALEEFVEKGLAPASLQEIHRRIGNLEQRNNHFQSTIRWLNLFVRLLSALVVALTFWVVTIEYQIQRASTADRVILSTMLVVIVLVLWEAWFRRRLLDRLVICGALVVSLLIGGLLLDFESSFLAALLASVGVGIYIALLQHLAAKKDHAILSASHS